MDYQRKAGRKEEQKERRKEEGRAEEVTGEKSTRRDIGFEKDFVTEGETWVQGKERKRKEK